MAGVINDLIREIVVEMGATAMTITHDMSSVRAIADRVAMLHDGVIQWTGPVAEMDDSGDPMSTSSSTAAPKARSRRCRCDLVLLIGGAVLGLPWMVVAAPLLLPAGLALSLQTELADLERADEARHLGRLLIAAFAAMALVGAAAVL
jgi:hypothetical protein